MPRSYSTDSFPATLNAAKVAALPIYKLPRTYSTGTPGMGCHMDPPGYPTYYIMPVYNQHGNTPRNAPDAVIMGPDGVLRRLDRVYPKSEDYKTTAAESDRRWKAAIHRLWAPLSLEHARSEAWIRTVFGYFRAGWLPANGSRNVADLKFIGSTAQELRWVRDGTFHAHNPASPTASEGRTPRDVRTYRPVDYVLEFYPDADPTALFDAYIDRAHYGKTGIGDWWTTEAERPTVETCPGMRAVYDENWPKHQSDGCQFCGY